MKFGCFPFVQNTNYSPLHMAVIAGHIAIVNQLLDKGADLESRDGDHMTPVHRYLYTLTECFKEQIW